MNSDPAAATAAAPAYPTTSIMMWAAVAYGPSGASYRRPTQKELAKRWADLSEAERQPFVTQRKLALENYRVQLDAYHALYPADRRVPVTNALRQQRRKARDRRGLSNRDRLCFDFWFHAQYRGTPIAESTPGHFLEWKSLKLAAKRQWESDAMAFAKGCEARELAGGGPSLLDLAASAPLVFDGPKGVVIDNEFDGTINPLFLTRPA